MNGAELVVEGLRKQGVEQVFGYPGGAIMPVYDALYESGVNHLLCRHEQGAVMAAIGYARASGKVGVCIATSGPGATNLITGLADALADSVPLVALTGQVPVAAMGTDAFQECDILGMSLSCTKHSILVEDVAELPAALEEAFAVAQEGRAGPVLVDLPKNVQQATVPEAVRVAAEKSFCPTKPASDTVISDTLAQACELLHTARKPVLYVGGGVGMAGAVEELRSFIRKTGIPVVTTLKGLGAPDPEGAETLGMLGMHGTHAANLAVQECDLLIAAGARFDDRVTGKLESFAPHASVLHMDIDPAELGKRRTPHVRMAGDLKTLLPALEAGVQEELAASLMSWRAHVAQLKKSDLPPEILGEETGHDPEAGINAPQFLRALSAMLPPRSVVTTDVGQHQMWSAQHMRFDGPENFITSGGMGTMGFGLPAALGAQAARPEDQVVCVTGDGSFLMNVQELATLGRGKLPVRIVLLDNQRLGMVRQWQELFFEGRFSETILNDNPDFVLLARAFGIPGRRIEKPVEVPEAITEMLASEGPYLLHVSIKALENVWPLVPPGAGNETMLEDMP